jgi:hypothetical protein
MYFVPAAYLLIFCVASQQSGDENVYTVPSCSVVHLRGRQAKHSPLGEFDFRIPRGLKYRRVVGEEGDIHDRITVRSTGELNELTIFTANATWGPVKRGPTDWPIQPSERTGTVREWKCPEGSGYDFRLHRDGRSWRFLGFPWGFAEYKNISEEAARKFDRVLDSLCCEKFVPTRAE